MDSKSEGANANIVLAMELPINPQLLEAATSRKTTYAEGDILSITWSVEFNLRSKESLLQCKSI